MRATVGQDDGHVQDIDGLPREKRAFGGDGLGFVEVFDVVVQQILSIPAPLVYQPLKSKSETPT